MRSTDVLADHCFPGKRLPDEKLSSRNAVVDECLFYGVGGRSKVKQDWEDGVLGFNGC